MLGALLAGTVAVFAIAGARNSIKEKERRREQSKSSGYSYSYQPATYGGTDYDDKVEFLDAYRELDSYLADFVGESYRGITYLRSGVIGYVKRTGDKNWREYARELKEAREWRNYLSHNKNKWHVMQDPPSDLTSFLKDMLRWAVRCPSHACELVEDGKDYLNSYH